MIHVKNCSTNLLQLYVTLSLLNVCYKISRDQDSFSLRYANDWVLESTNYFGGLFRGFKMLNTYDRIINYGAENNNEKSLHGYKTWRNLIDELVDFDHNNNCNITTYPVHIRPPNSPLSTNSSNSEIPCLHNNIRLHTASPTLYWSSNMNDMIGTGDIEDIGFNNIIKKDKLLDNSFYDLHLNTAVNGSSDNNANISPLRKDTFLQNVNNNSCEESRFYNANLTEVTSDMTQQVNRVSEMADVLYKQDVDLGYALSSINSPYTISSSTQSNRNEEAEKVEAIQSLKDSRLAEILYQQDIDLGYILSSESRHNDEILNDMPTLHEDSHPITDRKAINADEIIAKGLADNAGDGWAGIPFKIDNETGEYIRLPLDDLFHDILPFTENDSNTLNSAKVNKTIDGEKNSAELLEPTADDISLIMQSFWTSTPDQKADTNLINGNGCRQGLCNISEPETKSADLSGTARIDSRIQDIANLFAPVPGFYGINPEITPYTHYHAHYPSKNNSNLLSYASRQPLHNAHNEDVCFQPHLPHNLEPAGPLSLNTSYSNSEIHCIKNFTNSSVDLVPTESFLSSFLNEECVQMMDVSGNERSPTCNQAAILPMDSSSSVTTRAGDKSVGANGSLCANNIAERLDLSCDSAVSSLGSERVASTSDGEWGEGSDSGQDYHQGNYYGPYDYSSSSRNFTPRQMPVAQKKYHMFGKRYFQEQTPENTIIHSAIHFLHSTNSTVECDGIENMIDNTAFDDCNDEILPLSNVKSPSKLTHLNVKSERDKYVNNVVRPQISHDNLIRHNHTYTLLHNSASSSRFSRDSSECKDIIPDGHLTRDEKRARNLNVPIPVTDIINLPMDEFNERISKYDLTENQLSLIRDIRRRGKNKVAAQNCRKRKLDQILTLEGEVKEVRRRKEELHNKRDFIAAEKKRIANKFATLHQHIFQFLRDAEGNPCSPSKYSLQQASDGSIYLLPRDSSKLEPNCHMSILIGSSDTSSTGCRQRRMPQSFVRANLNESPSTGPMQPQINSSHEDD